MYRVFCLLNIDACPHGMSRSNYQSRSKMAHVPKLYAFKLYFFLFFGPQTPNTQGPNLSKGTFFLRGFFNSVLRTKPWKPWPQQPSAYLYRYVLSSSLRIKIYLCLWIHIRNCYELFSN